MRPSTWTEHEDKILAENWAQSPRKELAEKLGRSVPNLYHRARQLDLGVVNRKISENAKKSFAPSFDELRDLPQVDFYNAIAERYAHLTRKKLTYKKLADLTYYSHNRIQKLFAPGSSQQHLSTPIKHHMWLAVTRMRKR